MTERPVRTAGMVSRAVAGLVDYLVAACIMAGGYAGIIFVMFLLGRHWLDPFGLRWWFTTSGYFVLLMFYLFACWATSGRTVGAVMMGLRVTRWKGGRLPVVRAAMRAVTCVVFPIGLVWVALSPERRSLQDVLVRSRVIYTH